MVGCHSSSLKAVRSRYDDPVKPRMRQCVEDMQLRDRPSRFFEMDLESDRGRSESYPGAPELKERKMPKVCNPSTHLGTLDCLDGPHSREQDSCFNCVMPAPPQDHSGGLTRGRRAAPSSKPDRRHGTERSMALASSMLQALHVWHRVRIVW